MDQHTAGSEFRFEKRRSDAVLSLVTGEVIRGCFFTAAGSTHREGAERIADLLNSETGFFPFEVGSPGRTVLYNRLHVITGVLGDEARQDPGYYVAPQRSSPFFCRTTSGWKAPSASTVPKDTTA